MTFKPSVNSDPALVSAAMVKAAEFPHEPFDELRADEGDPIEARINSEWIEVSYIGVSPRGIPVIETKDGGLWPLDSPLLRMAPPKPFPIEVCIVTFWRGAHGDGSKTSLHREAADAAAWAERMETELGAAWKARIDKITISP